MTEAATIARAFGGRHIGGGAWLARCPLPSHGKGRGDRNPSVKISDNPGKRDGIDVVCFGGCDWQNIKAEYVRLGLLTPISDIPQDDRPIIRAQAPPPVEPDPEALSLWKKAQPVTGTKAESYLRSRGITIDLPPTIRFLPDHVHLDQLHLPAMICAVQAGNRRVLSVQVTLLDPRADRKAQVSIPRKTTGPLSDGAIRLAKHGSILGLAEGTETALSAMELFDMPCWSSLGCKRLGSVKLPIEVDEVHLFADNDAPGREAADKAADAYNRQGRRVLLRFPPEQFNDWNDVLKNRSAP